ncbi:MAG: hypothetical protein LBN06_12670, partial [Prevotellaceae bacterium]|nr:hypothetical protein [Prevotellaceae bacterium]
FSQAELYTIDRFWFEMQKEEMIRDGSLREGIDIGIAQSEAKVKAAEAKAAAAEALRAQDKLDSAKHLKTSGIPIEIIMQATGLSHEDIEQL